MGDKMMDYDHFPRFIPGEPGETGIVYFMDSKRREIRPKDV